MEPTPFADRLAGPVRAALEGLGTALDSAAAFDPATVERGFTVALDNRATLVLAAPVAAAIAAEAPGVSLDLRPSGTLDVAERLDRADLDLALGSLAAPGERFSDLRLFENSYVALMRRGHPLATNGKISMAALGAIPHLDLSSTGEGTEFVDAELARHGLARRVALRAPLLAAATVLAQSDMGRQHFAPKPNGFCHASATQQCDNRRRFARLLSVRAWCASDCWAVARWAPPAPILRGRGGTPRRFAVTRPSGS